MMLSNIPIRPCVQQLALNLRMVLCFFGMVFVERISSGGLQVLVVVANSQMGTLEPEVEKGAM